MHLDPYRQLEHEDAWRSPNTPALDRLTHLVLVDGRLVDVWSEPVHGTSWEHHARRHDAERRPPEPPPVPPHERALQWLDAQCGGRAAVLALDDSPRCRAPRERDVSGVEVEAHRARLTESLVLLDHVAARFFDEEVGTALGRALLRVWAEDASVITGARSSAVVAGGVCWAVGKANGLFLPGAGVSTTRVRDALDHPGNLSTCGQRIRTSLVGLHAWPGLERHHTWAPGAPDLQALGHADLLVATTRRDLVRLRDRALAAAG
jgi:hypothetical protein